MEFVTLRAFLLFWCQFLVSAFAVARILAILEGSHVEPSMKRVEGLEGISVGSAKESFIKGIFTSNSFKTQRSEGLELKKLLLTLIEFLH